MHVRQIVTSLLFVLGAPLSAAAQCGGTQLCAGGAGPCTVNAACTVAAGSQLDVRPRPLVVAQGVTLTVGPGTEAVRIIADGILLEAGARVVLQGTPGGGGSGGTLELVATNTLTARTGSVLDATGSDAGGEITIDAGGNVILDGVVDASCNAQTGVGGAVTVTSRNGRVGIGGNGLHANGGQRGDLGAFGGTVAIAAATDVTIDAPVEAARGDCFFCGIDVYAALGQVTTTARGTLDVRGTGGLGGGGQIDVTAGGPVEMYGAVLASAAGSLEAGGERGGTLGATSWAGSVTIAGSIDARGAGPDGDGGTVVLDAALDVRCAAPIWVQTAGQGEGGAVSIGAGRSLILGASLDARGGGYGGGLVEGEAAEALDVLGTATLLADGRSGGPGGSIELEGCRVDVRDGAILSALGAGGAPSAGTRLTAHGPMSIAGLLRADPASGRNALISRATAPILLPSANVAPPAQSSTDPALACCEACPVTTTSTTTTTSSPPTTSSTTTSTAPSSTSTTSSSTTTSTSTSSSTSTTLDSTSTTTTSVPEPPPACADAAAGSWVEVVCRLGLLRAALDAESDDALGGARSARNLRRHVGKAERQITIASTAERSVVALRRAARELRRFESSLARAERRGLIASPIARGLRALHADVGAALIDLREPAAQGIRSASTVSIDQASQAAANSTMPTSRSLW